MSGTRDVAASTAQIPDVRAIRKTIAQLSYSARSAHFGSSLSCVEILNAIVATSNVRPANVDAPDRDRIIMSKGHAAMAYYAVMQAHDLIDASHLINYLQDGTALWGHVTRSRDVPVIDASTGSLGHGLGLALGYAQAYRLKRWTGQIYCVLSDGELDEGSNWEAILYAGARAFSNLTSVVDYNKIQSIDRVENVLSLEPLLDKWRAFGWSTDEVDGHDVGAIMAALRQQPVGKPHAIIAHTIKGKGIPRIENTVDSHYKAAMAEDVDHFS